MSLVDPSNPHFVSLKFSQLQNQCLRQTPITILDVETTGTSPPSGDRLIEIAMLQVLGDEVIAHVDSLVNPQRSLRSGATAVNGITPDMVVGQPPLLKSCPG